MRKLSTLAFFSFSLVFLAVKSLHAQCNTGACGSPFPSVDASQACVLPNPGALDCYFGATTFDSPVSLPPSWCTTVENNDFFGVTADAATASFNICTFGCASGTGIQAAVLSTTDCINFTFASGCLGGINSGACQGLAANGLTVGQTYYLMIDGSAGSVCDYSINGVNPTINGPTAAICLPNPNPSVYTTNTISTWTINPPTAGTIQGNAVANNVSITWNEPGHAEVCAQSVLCPNAPNLCLPVNIGEAVSSTEMVEVCQGSTVECAGRTFSSNGTFPVRLATHLGCDSIINCVVRVIPTVTTTQNVRMCVNGTVNCAGVEFDTPGTFPVTLTAYQGCDSIVRCMVSVIPPINMPIQYVTYCGAAEHAVCEDIYSETSVFSHTCISYLGCDSVVNIDLAILEPQAVIAPPAVLNCGANQVITLDGSGSSVNTATTGITVYSWSGPGIVGFTNQPTIKVNQPGDYCLIVRHARGAVGCSDTTCVTVQASAIPPGATATGGNITCFVKQTTLTGTATTTGPVNYTWTGPGINPGNQFLQNPTVTQLGVYTVTIVNPANGCSSTAQATVTGDTLRPNANAVGGVINCLQNNVTIDGITNAATTGWNWAGPGINPGNQTLENPNVLQSGTYTVTVTNTVNGCTSTASTTVSLNTTIPSVAAGANDTLTCLAPTIALQGSGSGGGEPISFSWTGPNGFVSDSIQPVVNVAGTYILTVLNTLNGCQKKDTVVISSNQVLPIAAAGADSTINCSQPAVFLIGGASSIGPNFTAAWTGPGINPGNINSYNPEVTLPGNYNLVITNTLNGCTATDLVIVDQNTALPTALAGADQQLTCSNPNGVNLNGGGVPATVTYLWTGPGIGANNETQQNPLVSQQGTYDLVVTNPINGCTATDQVIVTQDANVPVASGGPDQVLNCTVTIINLDGSASDSGPGITYSWAGPGISGNNATAQSPSGLTEPGTYNLTVTNTNNNCVSIDVVVVLIDTIKPLADAGNPLILNCFNNGIDTLDGSGSNLGSIYSLLWAGPGISPANENSVNPVINNQSGTYTLTVTNTDNTCTATDQVTVALDQAAPIADAGVDKTIDCVTTSTLIGGTSSTGANFTYQWSGPGIDSTNANLATPNINQAGAYSLLVTNSINGCTATNDVLINTTALLPNVLAGNDGLLTCANPTAILDGSGSDAGGNFQILWSGPGINASNQNLISPSITVQGTYILQITNTVNSCIQRDTVVVDENKVIPAAEAGLDLILDCLTNNVTLDGSLSTVSPTIVYSWAGPGIGGANQNVQTPNINQPGTYDLIVTDTENGCSDTDQVQVAQDTVAPTANAGADGLITCALLTETLDGSGNSAGPNIEYIWDGPGINSGNFNVQSPIVTLPGTYNVTVTNAQNHCFDVDVVLVNVDQNLPIVSAGPDRTLDCSLTTAQLDATQSAQGPNISFLWSGPGLLPGEQTSATPMVNLPGTYLLTITDANNGCTNTESAFVNIDTLSPTVFAGSNMVLTCANATTGITLSSAGSDSGPNFTYLWTGPGITPANENLPNPTVTQAGTYTLSITNTNNGCGKTDEVLVESDQNLPTAEAGSPQTITCSVTEVTLDGTGSSSPNGDLTYQWAGPGINGGNATIGTPTVLLSGTYTLTVTNTTTGCSASDQVIVNLDTQLPIASATSEIITCIDLSSTVAATSSLPNSTYFWTGPDVNPSNDTSQTLQATLAGLYEVTVTAPNGCTSTASTTVAEDANVPQGLTNGTVLNCLNNSSSQISGEVLSPSGSTFNWTGPGIGTQTTASITVTQPGTYTFTIFAPNGCVRPFTEVVVGDFVQPTVVAAAADVIDCNTPEVTINANASSFGPNYTFFWTTTNGHFTSGTNTLTPKADKAGLYELRIVNELNGCSDSISVPVMVDPAVPSGFDLTVNNIRCFGDVNGSILINGVVGGTPPFNYSLTGAGATNNQYTGLAAGQYTLALEDANGCLLDTTFTISEPGELLVELGPDVKVSLGENATVTAQIESSVGIKSVVWNSTPGCIDSMPYCQTFTYLPFDTYKHQITVVDSNGCEARDQVLVIVQKPRNVYVPNIFNPNSSENAIETVYGGIDVAKIHFFHIFDRWGDKVFEAIDFLPNDLSKGWDGKIRGQEGQLGVYVWYCEVEFIDGEVLLLKGDVTLVR